MHKSPRALNMNHGSRLAMFSALWRRQHVSLFILYFCFYVIICFSELLQSLDMCDNDPVAIAQSFVDKVSRKYNND